MQLGQRRDRQLHGMTNWRRRGAVGLFALSLCQVLFVGRPAMVLAASRPNVSMTTVVGYADYYEKNQWVPVEVSIFNKDGDAEGELALQVSSVVSGERQVDGTLTWPIHLLAHRWTKQYIAVPAVAIDDGATLVLTVRGEYATDTSLSGNALQNVALVAVLATHPQAAQFLTGTTFEQTGEPVLPVTVTPDSMPDSANLFDGLTAVAGTPAELSDLSQAQRSALLTWVKLGGLLIVTGTEGTTPEWQSALPLVPGNIKQVPADGLKSIVGVSVSTPKQISTAVEGSQAGAVTLARGSDVNNPLISKLTWGRGAVIQTSFEPVDLLGWGYNATLWTSILKSGNPGEQTALPSFLDPSTILPLMNASSALSPLRVPSLKLWVPLFALYVLIAGPALFAVLRKWRKEPLAWLVLPTLSLLATVGIYGFGASQRPSGMLAEGVGVLELTGDGKAEAYGIRAFTAPTVADVQLSTAPQMTVLPLSEGVGRQQGSATVETGSTGTRLSLSGVGRWRVRYAYTAGAVDGQGMVSTSLQSSLQMLYGDVQNNTPYTLHNAVLVWNGSMYPLGDMAPNATVTISPASKPLAAGQDWLSAYSAYNKDISRGLGRSLANFAATSPGFNKQTGVTDAMLVATTSSATPGLPQIESIERMSADRTVVLVREFAPVDLLLRGAKLP